MERKPYYPHLIKGFEKLEQPLAEMIEFERIADEKIAELEKGGDPPPAPHFNPPGMNGQKLPDNRKQQIALLKQQKADLNKKFDDKVSVAIVGVDERQVEKLYGVIKYHRSPNQFKTATKEEVSQLTSKGKSLDRSFDFIAKKHFAGLEGDSKLLEQRRELSLDEMSKRFYDALTASGHPSDLESSLNMEAIEPDKDDD